MFVDLRLRNLEVQHRRELLSPMYPGRKPEKSNDTPTAGKRQRRALWLRQPWLTR